MRNSQGTWVVRLRAPGRALRRVCQWMRSREDWITYVGVTRSWLTRWLPWRGLLWVTTRRLSDGAMVWDNPDHWETMMAIKKRDVTAGGGGARPPLPADSKTFGKLPSLMEFLTATTYEDGTTRTPGYMWVSNRVVAFEVTLFDVDSCAKVPCLGRTLDEALALAETHLRAEDAPWQQDTFLLKKLQEKKRK